LEVGLQTTVNGGPHNRPIEQVRKLGSYQRFVLRGTRAHTADMRRQGIATPAMLNVQPFINPNVPRALWDQWVKEHKDSPVLKNNEIFEVKGGGEANSKAASLDAMAASPAPFSPVDPSKPVKFGQDEVTKAVFD